MKKPTLTIMSGLPRSGKSTWISKNKTDRDVIVSPDIIRKEIFGHQFHQSAENFIWALTDTFLLLLAQQRKNIILDAVNMTSSIRYKYKRIVEPYDYKIKLVYLNTKLNECLRRNKNSKDKKVPSDVIINMNTGFSFLRPPYDDEFDEIIEIKNGKGIKLK